MSRPTSLIIRVVSFTGGRLGFRDGFLVLWYDRDPPIEGCLGKAAVYRYLAVGHRLARLRNCAPSLECVRRLPPTRRPYCSRALSPCWGTPAVLLYSPSFRGGFVCGGRFGSGGGEVAVVWGIKAVHSVETRIIWRGMDGRVRKP